MWISLKWLNRYVDLGGLEPQRIADDLTLGTAEIEGIANAGDDLEEIVVGRVVECSRHPGADKLLLAKVDGGGDELLPIVCGAPNVAAGQSIALCKVGARLPAGGKRLKKTKIRGEVSLGMICSERELGISDDHTGILVLDTDAAPGTPVSEVLPVRDTLFEVDNKSITHRPDLWGHYGFARELAATYGRELRPFLEGRDVPIPKKGRTVPIDVEPSGGLCPRYTGLVFEDVVIQRAPDWMRYLLIAVRQRPINNIVDLTNFLLHDLGQPMHAFDMRRLAGPEIVVRPARDGEVILTLDGFQRRLGAHDLLICDAEGPVALAGVMGGEGTMVEEDTREVFLESANFDAATIRRTATRLGLRTESSTRFEKSLDPSWAGAAAEKFAGLMPEVSPGCRVAGPLTDPAGWRFEGRQVRLRIERASKVLGVELDPKTVQSYLAPLGFDVRETGWGGFDVGVPSWRATKDIEIEEDLIEELGRRHRYDNIQPEAPRAAVEATHREPELYLLRKIRESLAHDCGYHEAYNYLFLADELCEKLGLAELPYARVTNAIASHMTRVRRDVLPSLLGSLALNLRHHDVVSLFEVGKGYRPEEEGEVLEQEERTSRLPHEVHQVAAILADRRKGAPHPYASLRGHLELVLERQARGHLPVRRLSATEARKLPWMHPARTAVFHDPDNDFRIVAYAGELHPNIPAALDLALGDDGGLAALGVDLRALLLVAEDEPTYTPTPKFPPQPVDLAFLVDEEVTVAAVEAVCRHANPKLVRTVQLFEVYRGKGLPDGKKSLNFTVTLGSNQRTLTTDDEEKYIQRVREGGAKIGAELRG